MPKKSATLKRDQAYREGFLGRLNQKLAIPSPEWPTVRCWTEPALGRIIKQVRDELEMEGMKVDLSHRALLDWICHLRLAAQLPVEGESIYVLEIGADSEMEADPMELLMAARPLGVICYFSAVAFHSLTTQLVEHHHVAEPRPRASKPQSDRGQADQAASSVSRGPRGLGKHLFSVHGIPFYATRRSDRLIPGIQTRGYGPRSRIRITTLEQTLLDTLYKPFHCGGPEVVFEAWHEGFTSRGVDEDRLVAHLRAMDYFATTRRLGAMLEILGVKPGAELRKILESRRVAIDRQSPHARISLLPGVDYQSMNESWLVRIP